MMKDSIKKFLGAAFLMALPLMFTSCDEIIGELDNPLENLPNTVEPTTYPVDLSAASGDITIESDGAVVSGDLSNYVTLDIKAGVSNVTIAGIRADVEPYLTINCNDDVTLNLSDENYINDINTNGHTITINISDATGLLYISNGLGTSVSGNGTIKLEGGKMVVTATGDYHAIESNVIVTGGVLRAAAIGSGNDIHGNLTVSGSGAVYIGNNNTSTTPAVSGTVTGAYAYTGSWSADKLNNGTTTAKYVSTDNSSSSFGSGEWVF